MNTVSTRIFIALVAGLVGGILLSGTATGTAMLAVTAPLGRLWLDGLTMTIVPLVFSLLVIGIAGNADSAASGRTTVRALIWFAILLVSACAISALVVTVALGAWPVSAAAAALHPATAAPQIAPAGSWVENIVPANPIKAAADTAIMPLVVFAFLFAFAMTRIEPPLRDTLRGFFKAIVQVMLVIVQWVLLVGPIGVFALAFGVGAQAGVAALGVLAQYILLVIAVCLTITALAYALAALGGTSPLAFARAVLPVQVVAVSTQSSLASLPAMIEAARRIGTPDDTAAVVLPLAVSIFRAASAAANVAVAVYLSHVYGHATALVPLVIGVIVAAPVSLAAVGLPAQVSFFATIGPVCLAMGVPLDLLPLLLAVETLPDIFRTLGNTSVDVAVSRLVSRARADPAGR